MNSSFFDDIFSSDKVERFAKIVNSQNPFSIFAKHSIFGTWEGSEYASAYPRLWECHILPWLDGTS